MNNKIKEPDECKNLKEAVKAYNEKLVDDCDLLLLKTERTGWHLGKKGEKKSPEEHFNFLSSTDFQELKFLKELPKKIESMEKEAAKTMGKLHDYFKEFKKTCDAEIENAFAGAEKDHPIKIANKTEIKELRHVLNEPRVQVHSFVTAMYNIFGLAFGRKGEKGPISGDKFIEHIRENFNNSRSDKKVNIEERIEDVKNKLDELPDNESVLKRYNKKSIITLK